MKCNDFKKAVLKRFDPDHSCSRNELPIDMALRCFSTISLQVLVSVQCRSQVYSCPQYFFQMPETVLSTVMFVLLNWTRTFEPVYQRRSQLVAKLNATFTDSGPLHAWYWLLYLVMFLKSNVLRKASTGFNTCTVSTFQYT